MPINSFLQPNLSWKFVHNIQIPWIINFKIQRLHLKLWYPDWATFSNPITLFLIPRAEAIVHSQENWSLAGIACFRRNYPEGHRGVPYENRTIYGFPWAQSPRRWISADRFRMARQNHTWPSQTSSVTGRVCWFDLGRDQVYSLTSHAVYPDPTGFVCLSLAARGEN